MKEPSGAAKVNSGVLARSPAGLPDSPMAQEEVRRQVIEMCVGVSKVMGMPRSVGEIFGFIFSSTEPKTFDAVVNELGISAGSASHGLRFLRRIGVIRPVYLARDRRDHYTAETSFYILLKGFLGEALGAHLMASHDRLEKLRANFNGADDPELSSLREKLEVLVDWHQQARKAMNLVLAELRQSPANASCPPIP